MILVYYATTFHCFFNALAVWRLHHPFLTCLLDSLELSRISNFLKFQIVSDFFCERKKSSGGTWDCNNVIIGHHIPIQTAKSGGDCSLLNLDLLAICQKVSRQTAWYQLTLMACINAERRCQLWVECDLFDTLSSSWFAATTSSACLRQSWHWQIWQSFLRQIQQSSNLSTCLLLLHKMREADVKAVTFVRRSNISHTHSYLGPFICWNWLPYLSRFDRVWW